MECAKKNSSICIKGQARQIGAPQSPYFPLTRIIHETSTAAADPGMFAALRSFGLLDVLSSTAAGLSVARLVSTPVCTASLRILMNNPG